MNWKVIFSLSLFGLAMAVASLFGWTARFEPFFWFVIFVIYAVIIARTCASKYFLHGFFASVVNGLWMLAAHAAFFPSYFRNNPELFVRVPPGMTPRIMLIADPFAGVLFGVVAGLFAWVGSKTFKRQR